MENTIEEVKRFIKNKLEVEFEIDPNGIDEDMSMFKNDFGLDSLELVELCIDIEKEFNIEIPDAMSENWGNMTISEVANKVSSIG